MAIERSCPHEPGMRVYYEIPRDVYHKLQDLAVVMNGNSATRPFAAKLRNLLDQVFCVIDVSGEIAN